MQHVAAYSILAVTVGLSLTRPRLGHTRLQPHVAAVLGALATLACGLLAWSDVEAIYEVLAAPVVTIVCLMIITLIAEQAGFFSLLASRIAQAAGGSGRRLFAYLFFAGTATGAVFTNDAAVLIFTPMVIRLVEEVEDDTWSPHSRVAFYFAVLYVANLVGPLVISNPINIVVASLFGIGFAEYAVWMFVPALVSIVTTYFGLCIFFRPAIPATYRVPEAATFRFTPFRIATAAVLALTLIGFFSEQATGIPTVWVAATGAATLMLLHAALDRGRPADVLRGVGWDVIVFVIGIFTVVNGLRAAGLTELLGDVLASWAEAGDATARTATAFFAGGCSAVMNNHPVADMMAFTIRDMPLEPLPQRLWAYAALIGGDLGPKMLPIGSLAAMLWFSLLRRRGVEVSYVTYIKIGVPVTLAAILLSVLTLNLEAALFAP